MNPGDRPCLDQFVRQHEALQNLNAGELIDGVVLFPGPVPFRQHGLPHAWLVGVVGRYALRTGLGFGDSCTTLLDDKNAPQPDVFLMLPPALDGTSRLNDAGYIEGPPDFIAEVAASSASLDLHGKLRAYQSSGVREYLVWRTLDGAFDWFRLEGGEFRPQTVEEGVVKSRLFPGLWLDTKALLARNVATLYDTLEKGMATSEYREFAAAIAALPRKTLPT